MDLALRCISARTREDVDCIQLTEVVRQYRVSDGDVACYTFVKPSVCENTERCGQMLFPVKTFVL